METMMLQFDYPMKLRNEKRMRKEMSWWITNIMSSLQRIHKSKSDIAIYTDSITLGWVVTDRNNPSRSSWKVDEINYINVLELKAILIRAQTYCKGKNTNMLE